MAFNNEQNAYSMLSYSRQKHDKDETNIVIDDKDIKRKKKELFVFSIPPPRSKSYMFSFLTL